MPSKKVLDENNRQVAYPVIQFTERNKNIELIKKISHKGKPYIQENYLQTDGKLNVKREKKIYEPKNKPFKKQDVGPLWKRTDIKKGPLSQNSTSSCRRYE